MNSSTANKIQKVVPLVTPANASAKLRRSKEADEEVELQEAAVQMPRLGTSRDAVIPAIEENQSTSVFRTGRLEGESASPQASVENGTRPVANPETSSSWTGGSPPRTPQQQNDLDDDMDKIIAEIMDSDDETTDIVKQKLKNLQRAASALRKKRERFDSENSSPPSSSVNKSVRPPEEPLPEQETKNGSKSDHSDDPDQIIVLPDEEGGERGGRNASVLAEVQNVIKKEAASPSSAVRRRPRDHVAIEMGFVGQAVEGGEKTNPTYLETYLCYMFNCCLSPFRPDGSTGGIWGYCIKFCFVQVIIYWMITIVAILSTLTSTKFNCLTNIVEGGLENFTNMCFFIMNSCLKIYSAYLFTVQQQRFAKMLQSFARLRSFAAENSNVTEAKYQTWKITLLFLTSMTISTLSVIFQPGVLEWTMEKGLLKYAHKIAVAVYIWTPEAADGEGPQMDFLYNEFGKNLTGNKALMGLVGLGMTLFTRVIVNSMSDLMLSTAATIEKEMDTLAQDVGNPQNDPFPVTMETFECEDGQWAHYQLLKQVIEDTNDTFDSLLRYIHVDNLMLVVFFMMNVFDNDFAFFTIVNLVYNIIKAGCTYRVGAKGARNNDTYQEWIRRLIWKSDDKQFIRKAYVIIDRMTKQPLGLGRGLFLIDENFLFRFVGTGGSVFVLQAQAREAAMTDKIKCS